MNGQSKRESTSRRATMPRHRFIRWVLAVVLCAAAGSAVVLWRLGLAPLYAGLVGMNVVALLLYGYDKRQAIAGGVRIPEAALHVVALLGGSPGALLGQELFRHKTRKQAFRLVLAAIFLVQAAMIYGYWRFVRGT
jgi:uncharacterized membrane protein YsdA (DUF1294 family)